MDSRFYEEEKERILEQVRKKLDELFPHKLHFPTCWKCKQEMCEVLEKGKPNFFQCFEVGCYSRKEWSI